MSITLHIHPDQFKVELGAAASDHPAYIVIGFDKTHDVVLFLDNPARCDALIAAATEAKRLLAGASAAADLDHAIAADVDEQTAPGELYSVVNLHKGNATKLAGPMPLKEAEAFARQAYKVYPGVTEVVPAPQSGDVDARLRQDGEALGRRIAADEGIEPEPAGWACENCEWVWPLPGRPPAGSECDNCGGELVPVPGPRPARPEDLDDADGES